MTIAAETRQRSLANSVWVWGIQRGVQAGPPKIPVTQNSTRNGSQLSSLNTKKCLGGFSGRGRLSSVTIAGHMMVRHGFPELQNAKAIPLDEQLTLNQIKNIEGVEAGVIPKDVNTALQMGVCDNTYYST